MSDILTIQKSNFIGLKWPLKKQNKTNKQMDHILTIQNPYLKMLSL